MVLIPQVSKPSLTLLLSNYPNCLTSRNHGIEYEDGDTIQTHRLGSLDVYHQIDCQRGGYLGIRQSRPFVMVLVLPSATQALGNAIGQDWTTLRPITAQERLGPQDCHRLSVAVLPLDQESLMTIVNRCHGSTTDVTNTLQMIHGRAVVESSS